MYVGLIALYFHFLNLVKLFCESGRIFLLKDCFHVLWFLLLLFVCMLEVVSCFISCLFDYLIG